MKNSHNTSDCFKWNGDGLPGLPDEQKAKPKSSCGYSKNELHVMFKEWKSKDKSSKKRVTDDDTSDSSDE